MLRRLIDLDAADRRLLCEAAMLMAATSIGLHLLRFGILRRAFERLARTFALSREHYEPSAMIARVRWAITSIGKRIPGATCLVQALAADLMLRRRGLGCQINIGVRPVADRAGVIAAHAWLEHGGAVVLGDIADLDQFTLLTTLRSS